METDDNQESHCSGADQSRSNKSNRVNLPDTLASDRLLHDPVNTKFVVAADPLSPPPTCRASEPGSPTTGALRWGSKEPNVEDCRASVIDSRLILDSEGLAEGLDGSMRLSESCEKKIEGSPSSENFLLNVADVNMFEGSAVKEPSRREGLKILDPKFGDFREDKNDVVRPKTFTKVNEQPQVMEQNIRTHVFDLRTRAVPRIDVLGRDDVGFRSNIARSAVSDTVPCATQERRLMTPPREAISRQVLQWIPVTDNLSDGHDSITRKRWSLIPAKVTTGNRMLPQTPVAIKPRPEFL